MSFEPMTARLSKGFDGLSPNGIQGSLMPPELRDPLRRALGLASGLAVLGLPIGLRAQPAAGTVAPAGPAAPRPPRPIFVLNSQDATVSVVDPVTWT